MADFRLDRLKFRWKGNWNPSTVYTKDDIVYYDGKAFVCLSGHTASNSFYDDFEADRVTTYLVTVAADTLHGNANGKFYINGEENPEIELINGRTYIFDQSDNSNSTFNGKANPFLLSITDNGSLNGGVSYETLVSYRLDSVEVTAEQYLTGFIQATSREIEITISETTPSTLYYYSSNNLNLGNKLTIKYNSYWELMFDGLTWNGDWQPGIFYSEGSIVKFNGYLYKSVTSHTSTSSINIGLPANIQNWMLYATGYNWLNEWNILTYYDLGDVVRYNGKTYICNEKHRSNASTISGLEADQSKWTLVTRSDNWLTDWETSTHYLLDDLVRYGGNVYRCTTTHVSAGTNLLGLENNISDWEVVLGGIEYKGTWTAEFRYKQNDVVKYGGILWKASAGHTSTLNFREDGAVWSVWIPGLEYEELWSSSVEYQIGDIVLYGGYTYTALTNNINSVPSVNGILQNTGDWELLVKGYKFRNDWNSFDNYYTGDVIRQNGYLYIAVSDNVSVQPDSNNLIWKILVPGNRYRKEWLSNETYYIGDIALYRGTAYVCITRHQASISNSRPDLDIAEPVPLYWQVLIQGAENNVLADIGDIKTYDAGNIRLQIGAPGKVLKTSVNLPSWRDFEKIAKVYYVSTEGTDAPGFGLQLSSPFRSVKYACDYILADEAARAPATIFVKTGIYEENLPISIPANVAVVGDELRSTVIMPAEGYESSNMFYVRNGTGIRNMTLQGLAGTLGQPNQYLTRRPTAGAFVSLDPGSGPDDTSVWITTKSPYVQNVTTFGTACVGMKIDGSLHNGGNDSIVANDFTQIISDGIGYWATNGGRSELVSVFTYYCHIGYLADEGGILRGTNGNNSYGTYGSVAEGFNPLEIPITGQVNNRTTEATVSDIISYGVSSQEIVVIGYSHAGQSYSNANITFNGSGFGASGTFTEFRNNAISDLRLIDPQDSTRAGGLNYTFIVNNAQSGTAGSIVLSQADTGTANDYIGQRIVIINGRGAGQYGIISGYDAVSKTAIVSRESDDANGWDHLKPGWPIESFLDSSTRYAIEPRIYVSEPAFTATEVTGPSADNWEHITYGEGTWVAVTEGGAGAAYTTYSTNGSTWSPRLSLGNDFVISDVVYTGAKFLIARKQTSAGANVSTILQSENGQTWGTVNLGVSGKWSSIASDGQGNVILVGADNSSTILRSADNGDTWTSVNLGTTLQNWSAVAYGNGKFVILDSSQGSVAYSSNNGASWTIINPLTTTPWAKVTHGNNRFVAIATPFAGTTKTAYSFDGITWYESVIEQGQFIDLSYGAGIFIATGTGNVVAKSTGGRVWRTFGEDSTLFTTTNSGLWRGSAYGDGKWVILKQLSTSWNTVVTGARAIIRAKVEGSQITEFTIFDPGSNYISDPTVFIIDNSNTLDATFVVRKNNGVLAQPNMLNRGSGYVRATATITGDGFADKYQLRGILNLSNVSDLPGPGANLTFSGATGTQYRVTRVESFTGTGPYSVTFSISPDLERSTSPEHNTEVIIREEYSQIRLTGHDFLDIGTGNFNDTNYPNLYVFGEEAINARQPFNEAIEQGGGRVFYTSTDQDGNFRVGNLFKVEQNTGIVTIDASQFQLGGLEELTLGGIQVGGTPVVIREFSKEPTFVANSNFIVPTQRAIASFLASRISGGGANATTNTLIAGQVTVTDSRISSATDSQINIPVKMNIKKGIEGHYLAMQYYAFGGAFDSLN